MAFIRDNTHAHQKDDTIKKNRERKKFCRERTNHLRVRIQPPIDTIKLLVHRLHLVVGMLLQHAQVSFYLIGRIHARRFLFPLKIQFPNGFPFENCEYIASLPCEGSHNHREFCALWHANLPRKVAANGVIPKIPFEHKKANLLVYIMNFERKKSARPSATKIMETIQNRIVICDSGHPSASKWW